MTDWLWSGKVRFPKSVEPIMTPLDSVQQFDNNPNNGAIDEITESIRVNGFTTVITVDSNTRKIVSGNHRWQALHGLGATHAPMIFLDYGSEEEAKRILIADNRTGQLARPDEAMLADMLKDLKQSDLGLAGTGYDDQALNDLLLELQTEPLHDFGAPEGPALYGLYEVTVAFDTPKERDEFYADMTDRYDPDNVRTADV